MEWDGLEAKASRADCERSEGKNIKKKRTRRTLPEEVPSPLDIESEAKGRIRLVVTENDINLTVRRGNEGKKKGRQAPRAN